MEKIRVKIEQRPVQLSRAQQKELEAAKKREAAERALQQESTTFELPDTESATTADEQATVQTERSEGLTAALETVTMQIEPATHRLQTTEAKEVIARAEEQRIHSIADALESTIPTNSIEVHSTEQTEAGRAEDATRILGAPELPTRMLPQNEIPTDRFAEIPSDHIQQLQESEISTQELSRSGFRDKLNAAKDQPTDSLTTQTPTQVPDLDRTADFPEAAALAMKAALNSNNPRYPDTVLPLRDAVVQRARVEEAAKQSKPKSGGLSTMKEPTNLDEPTSEMPIPGALEHSLSNADISSIQGYLKERLLIMRRENQSGSFAGTQGNDVERLLSLYSDFLSAEQQHRQVQEQQRKTEFQARKKQNRGTLTIMSPESQPAPSLPHATERYVLRHLLETAKTINSAREARAVLFELDHLLETRGSNVANVLGEPLPGTDGTVYDRLAAFVHAFDTNPQFSEDSHVGRLINQVTEKIKKLYPMEEGTTEELGIA